MTLIVVLLFLIFVYLLIAYIGIKSYGDKKFGEGYARARAEYTLGKALEYPLRKGVLSGDIIGKIFEPVHLESDKPVEFPLGFLTPPKEGEPPIDVYKPYTIPINREMAEKEYIEDSQELVEKGLQQAREEVVTFHDPQNQWERHYGKAKTKMGKAVLDNRKVVISEDEPRQGKEDVSTPTSG